MARACIIEDCGKPIYNSRGWCGMHYQRWRRNGDPLADFRRKRGGCSVSGCDELHHSHGYCKRHCLRWYRHGDPLGGGTYQGDPERFYREVVLTDGRGVDDPCLIWPYARDSAGYAQIRMDGQAIYVHLRVCKDVHGPAPMPSHEAAHNCGHGDHGCVTQGHLRWATRAENQADRLIHGTHNRGERHPLAKLTEPEVIEIRKLKGSMTQREIGELFGVDAETVGNIHRKEHWGWLDG